MRNIFVKIMYLYGWLFIRPHRWLWRQIFYGQFLLLWPVKKYGAWRWPNLHFYLLYKYVWPFFRWVHWDGWRMFCVKDNGRLKKTFLADLVQRIGRITVGYVLCGYECYHCGFEAGCQVELSNDETGQTFILEEVWDEYCEDGTDHRFKGITICPICGYRAEYEDGSL